ncbi:MAG: hypothetical protein IPK82_06760 [Polyangiaceae bacterium]|nr:hypothetical protein [Polyangiaceae bacterium]
MNRRKAQAKMKARIKKHRAEKKAGAPAAPVAKKTRTAKAAPAAESAG